MGHRKSVRELQTSNAPTAKIDRRRAELAAPFALGRPLMPQGKEKNWRRTWGKISDELFEARRLSLSDSALLSSLVDALRGSRMGTPQERELANAEAQRIRAQFDARTPFDAVKEEEPKAKESADVPTLDEFIAEVKRCRETFGQRMIPSQVLTLDEGGKNYEWPEGDALTVARQYARDVVFGVVVSGELERAACQRFLDNLESGGRERGFYFDVWEARLVTNFFKFFCTFPLLPWQVLVTSDLMAWKKPTGYRLRVKLFLSIGRKNGKTAWAGALALFFLLCDGEEYAELYSFAMTRNQAKICWRDSKRTVKANSELLAAVKPQQHALIVDKTDSMFVPLSSDSDVQDGLRASFSIGDEVEVWKTDELVDKIITSQLSRRQPVLILTGTAGKCKDEGYCYTQTQIFERFLLKKVTDDVVFDTVAVHIFRLDEKDNFEDPAMWPKANPSGSATQDWAQIERLAANMRVDLNFRYKFRRDICNLWNDSMNTGGTLPANLVNACLGYEGMPCDVRQLRKSFLEEAALHKNAPKYRCWGGADCGGLDDFFALTLMWPAISFEGQDPKMVVVNWYFTISENIDERGKRLNIPLRRWVDEGWITLAGAKFVDRMIVYEKIVELCHAFRVSELGWDPYRADDYVTTLQQEHGIVGTLVPQKANVLTLPCQLFQRAVLDKKAVFTDPVMCYMARNVDFTPDKWGGIRPLKPKAEEGDTKDERMKIDGVSSCINAIQRFKFPSELMKSKIAVSQMGR